MEANKRQRNDRVHSLGGWVMTELQHVYCYQMGSGNCFKVGRTKNPPERRKSQFSVGSPVKPHLYRDIETENASELETYIHQDLDPSRAENGEFFNVTAQELDVAVDRAVAFMKELQPLVRDTKQLYRKKPNDTMVKPSREMRANYRELRKLSRERYLIEQRIRLLASKIQVAIGDNCGMTGVASWKWVDRWTMDIERFKREQEALYENYKRDSGGRTFRLERVDLLQAADGDVKVLVL
jgi:hypothetical protein